MFDPDADDPLTRVTAELGEPMATYSVSSGRVRGKTVLAIALIFFSAIGNYVWWVHGPAQFHHLVLVVLFAPLVTGLSMLRHLSKVRGLHVLIYPTGLLRLHGQEVESFPWEELETVQLQTDNGEPNYERDESGTLTACWIAVDPPTMKLWDSGLTVTRRDGNTTTFTPAIGEYTQLVEQVQRGSFAVLWPELWSAYRAVEPVPFGPFTASWVGLHHGSNMLPWTATAEVTLSQKKLTVKRSGKWLPWAVVEIADVPNVHLLLALIAEVKRTLAPEPAKDSAPEPEA